MLQLRNNDRGLRLDATDLVWFKRQLEIVDKEQYEILFPENQARALIPTQPDVPDWASAYIWREFEAIGQAKIIGDPSDDLPRVTKLGRENAKVVKDIGVSYGYTFKEIKRSIAMGTGLDSMLAADARRAIETETDRILWLGQPSHSLDGLLKLDTVGSIVPIVAITKTGGGTNWSAAAKPDEIAGDIFKLIEETLAKGRMAGGRQFRSFRVVLPDANYTRAGQRRMGDGSDTTILRFVESSPFVESVNPVWRCSGAAANGVDDRMAIYPADRMVVAGIVPQEFTQLDPEKRNLEMVIDCTGSCAGVVLRYAFAVGYMDAIGVA